MGWRRLPSYLPNLALKLLPLDKAATETYAKTGFLEKLAFKVAPSTSKVRGEAAGRLGALRPWRGWGRAAAAASVCKVRRQGSAARRPGFPPPSGRSWRSRLSCRACTA